jgi:hypothetical protein
MISPKSSTSARVRLDLIGGVNSSVWAPDERTWRAYFNSSPLAANVKRLSSAVFPVALATRLWLLTSMISPKSSTSARVRLDLNGGVNSSVWAPDERTWRAYFNSSPLAANVKRLSSAVFRVALATRLWLLMSMISPKSSTSARVRLDLIGGVNSSVWAPDERTWRAYFNSSPLAAG